MLFTTFVHKCSNVRSFLLNLYYIRFVVCVCVCFGLKFNVFSVLAYVTNLFLFCLLGLILLFHDQSKRLAGKNIFAITYFVVSAAWNLNWVHPCELKRVTTVALLSAIYSRLVIISTWFGLEPWRALADNNVYTTTRIWRLTAVIPAWHWLPMS